MPAPSPQGIVKDAVLVDGERRAQTGGVEVRAQAHAEEDEGGEEFMLVTEVRFAKRKTKSR